MTDMATRSCTPFMHRFLYRDHAPRCIVSVFGACALYVHRSPGNVAMVMRALQAGVLDASSSAGCVATPVEKLARTQALFLYQIIRLFDGDVALQAAAERDLPLLKTWLSELCRLRDTNIAESHMQLEKSVSEMTQPLVEWEVCIPPLPGALNSGFSVVKLTFLSTKEVDIRRIYAEDNRHSLLGLRSL